MQIGGTDTELRREVRGPANMIRIPLDRMNRIATLAILPLMALAVVLASRVAGKTVTAPLPHEGLLVVAQLRGDALMTFDLAHGGASKTLALAGPPHELAEAGGRLYATLEVGDAVVEVEPGVPAVLRTLPMDGWPHGLAIDGQWLLVSVDKANELARIERSSMTEVSTRSTGATPHVVAVADGTAYVADAGDNTVRSIAPDGSQKTTTTGSQPEAIALAGGYVVTGNASGGTLTVVRRDTFQVARTIAVGPEPVRVVTLDAQRVLVAMNTSSRVLQVNVATGAIERSIPTLGHPDGICLSPSREYVAIASNAGGAVQFFRLADWAPAGTLAAGDGPGSCIWMAAP